MGGGFLAELSAEINQGGQGFYVREVGVDAGIVCVRIFLLML